VLLQKTKGQTSKEKVQFGEVVLELNPNTCCGKWKLAMIEEVFPTKDGLYEHPITKLIPLEF
jgi:hypothetical protein